VDITACPGTDTCKLGISSSRGLAAELSTRLGEISHTLDTAVQDLRIKISGCFNSCGQHHVADLGFYGVSRRVGNRLVPHFQLILGGQWTENGGSYGLAIGAVPAKRVPDAVLRLTSHYVSERQGNETFKAFVKRIGKVPIKGLLDDLTQVPAHEVDASFYSDWGDTRSYNITDMGVGECAGEVVARIDWDLAAAEREVFEAQVLLDKGDFQAAGHTAYSAMLNSARALVKSQVYDVPKDANKVVEKFRTLFYDTQLFWDQYAGGKFGQYLFRAHEQSADPYSPELAHQRIEEAVLVVEAAHSTYAKLAMAR
jgi:sulfite reductase (ferredoxin)